MKKLNLASMLFIILAVAGCYMPIKGRVIDAETQQPIEGAVVMVEWTKQHGFIDHWTESYKVVEVVSDKEGRVKIKGCYSPFVAPPHVTVYKKGYVAWNDEAIFQGRARTDFKWGDYEFKLVQFKPEYSYDQHIFFIKMSIRSSLNFESKQIIEKAIDWEEELAIEEQRRLRNK
ncbi:MAG: carboxypeptidase-like regulatory domain-containing protein [Nitrospirota bacterium]|nr:carboxypeptidase-like regulatory domain-containing protein [Nitrospirota bacterium]